MGLTLRKNEEYIQQGTPIGKINIYNHQFMNKYGRIPARLRRIYDAQKKLNTQREYLIKPSRKVKEICTAINDPFPKEINRISGMIMCEMKFLLK